MDESLPLYNLRNATLIEILVLIFLYGIYAIHFLAHRANIRTDSGLGEMTIK